MIKRIFLAIILLTSTMCYADVITKATDTSIKITTQHEQVVSLTDLQNEKARIEKTILMLQGKITEIDKLIADAKELGIKEEAVD